MISKTKNNLVLATEYTRIIIRERERERERERGFFTSG